MDLEQATDELYGSALDDFVSERARLAKELREAEDRDGAQAVAKLRKPTVAAWVLNQLARRNRRDVDLLLDAGHRLREAQAGALTGEAREGFEEARKSESEALRKLTREARRLLSTERGAASTSVVDQVEQTLRAAAVSEAGRELLARGRFVEPLRSVGFDVVSGLAPPAPASATRRKTAQRDERREAEEALKLAKATLREAEQAARAAEQSAERARAEWERADSAAQAAHAEVGRAEREVKEAEQRLERRK
jgi:hypothetical protein